MKNPANLAGRPQARLPSRDRLIIFRGIPIDLTKSLWQVLQHHTEWQLITSGCSATLERNDTTQSRFPLVNNLHGNTALWILGWTRVQIRNESQHEENESHLFHFFK